MALMSVCLNGSVGLAALLPEQTLVVHASEPAEALALAENYAQGRGLARLCELDGDFPLSISLERYNDTVWPAIKACLSGQPLGT